MNQQVDIPRLDLAFRRIDRMLRGCNGIYAINQLLRQMASDDDSTPPEISDRLRTPFIRGALLGAVDAINRGMECDLEEIEGDLDSFRKHTVLDDEEPDPSGSEAAP